MIEAGEVNGVRFPPGIIIDVNSVDGEKLVESKKAEYVDTSKSEDEVDETNVSSDAENKTDTTEVKTETESKETKEDKENNVKADGDNLADELAELSNSLTTEVEDNDVKKNKK